MSMLKRSHGNSTKRSKRLCKDDHGHSDGSSDSDETENTDDSIVENSVVTNNPKSSKEKLANGIEPTAGVIKRISVNNFMCHNHLEVTLGSHVNFIVGRNGSGKSAVITALVIGLGGKATATSRGTSIKNFIKSGKRSAWVEIVLSNKGKDSYKPNIYGDKIIVRRRFTAEGSSSYAICSERGQHISNRRDELSRITDYLNIQVDNPISILNQDTSRNFLNTKSAGDKFKFFMKATQLEQMNSDYDQVKRSKELTKQIITDKIETLHKMEIEVQEWETKFKNMTAVSELKVKVKRLKHEMAWALVAQKERGLKPLEKMLHVEKVALPKFTQKVEGSKACLKEWEVRHKEVEARLIDCGKEVKDLQPLLHQKKKEVQEAKDKLAPLTAQLRVCEREATTTERECKQCEERIEELKTVASEDYEAERQQREEEIARLESKLAEPINKQKVKENDMEQYRSAAAKHKKELATIEAAFKSKDHKMRDIQSTLNTLQSARNDRLQRYGPWMPEVIDKIKANEHKFHRSPKGPIGACFDLTDSKWALAVECCLKGLVSSFVCHDHHDETLLLSIFKSCSRVIRPTIITSLFCDKLHAIQNTRVRHDRFQCIIDVMKSKDPVIMNTLIDQRTVEKILLIEDQNEARHVMLNKLAKDARECFTLEGDQAFCHPTFRYYSSDKHVAKYLMADVRQQIAAFQSELTKLTEEKAAHVKDRDLQRRNLVKNEQEEKKSWTELNNLHETISRIRFDISEKQNMEDPVPVDVTTLEEEVSSFKQKIEGLQERRETIIQEKQTLEDDFNAVKEGYAEVEASIRERSDSGIPLREEISQAQVEVEKARNESKHYIGKLKDHLKKIAEHEEDIEKYQKELDGDREKALEICPPIETRRTDASIENEIMQIQRQIDEEEESHGSEHEIMETYMQKKQTLDKVNIEVDQLNTYVNQLDQVMEMRYTKYMEIRKSIASRTQYFFIHQMYQRSFTGKMKFDFTKQTLDILVNPSQGATGSATAREQTAKDLKSLSGGERSFSTVCFILSLWEAMESPFRCLDEFDVFMDMVNRRISMDMMMEAADMHKDMQFVFLTPQDMSNCKKIDNVKIFRMPDPERNQKVLTFSQSQDTSLPE